ncbi:putative ABC transporter transmembrane protein [Parafrankia sp. EAN1pec]|uniref:ABC transporter permease n=1 Tax=Parafrankia sp. (strain EAN1pec) TaxID=298653 RepID=UPI00005430E7|nr:putative ABC transporter transmembrane protein [Frankia sp. EAN1pec]
MIATLGSGVVTASPRLAVTQARVLRSEWTKFRSLRSPAWTLLIAVALTIGIGALISAVQANHYSSLDPVEKRTFDPISISLAGVTFAELAVGVLGVLLITGEYTTGMIRSSLTVVPGRLPVLWAKIGVCATVMFVVMLAAATVAFFSGQAVLDQKGLGVGITDAGALRSVVGSALAVTAIGVIGLALGALLRNTAAGISTFVAAFFVVPPLTNLLPDSWSSTINPYLPDRAASAVFGGGPPDMGDMLGPWSGFAVLCLYAAVLVGVAAWQLRGRDA